MADRPKVGPADAETRRKKLREMLDQPSKATGTTMKDAVDKGVEMGSESETLPNGQKRRANQPAKPKKKLVRRFGPQGKTMDEIESE